MAWAIITIYTSEYAQMNPQQLPKTSEFYYKCKKSVTSKNLRGWVPPAPWYPKVKRPSSFYLLSEQWYLWILHHWIEIRHHQLSVGLHGFRPQLYAHHITCTATSLNRSNARPDITVFRRIKSGSIFLYKANTTGHRIDSIQRYQDNSSTDISSMTLRLQTFRLQIFRLLWHSLMK